MSLWILTAALSEDGGAAEFEEPLCIEAGSVHGHCVLIGQVDTASLS